VVLGLGLVRVRPEVELVGGVRVVAGDSVGVRIVLGDDLLAGLARSESLRVDPANVAEAVWEVLMEWGVRTRWCVAGSHAMAHGDIEFELEADPNSNSACWL
jgi:hypothetical protein